MTAQQYFLTFLCIGFALLAQPARAAEAETNAAADLEGDKAGVSADATEAVAPSTAPKSTLTTTYQQRGEALQGTEDVVWFEHQSQRYWLLRESGLGSAMPILLVGDSNAVLQGSLTASLRRELSDHGWDTFFFVHTAPTEDDPALLGAAIEAMGGAQPLVIGQRDSCFTLVELALASAVSGAICIDVPTGGARLEVIERLKGFASLANPTLVLQRQPNGWPGYVALGTDVEIHLLPRASSVQRKVRGWLRRRFGQGS